MVKENQDWDGEALWKVGVSIAFDDGVRAARRGFKGPTPHYLSPELGRAWQAGNNRVRNG